MTSINDTELGSYIFKIIQERNWSIRKTGLLTGVSASYISKLINRRTDSNPKSETLDKLAKGLGISRLEIYRAAEQPMIKNDNADNSFDLGKAIDNNELILDNDKPLTQRQLQMIKWVLER